MGVFSATEQLVHALGGRFFRIFSLPPDQLKTAHQELPVDLEHGAHAGAVFVTNRYATWDKDNKNPSGDHLTSLED